MRKMKFVLINSLYPPYRTGGAEMIVFRVAKGLKQLGHEVVIITTKPWGKGNQSEEIQDIRVERFFPLNFFWFGDIGKKSAWLRFFWHGVDMLNIFSFFIIRRMLRQEQPDLVLTHNLKGIGYLIPFAIYSLRLPWIHTVHDVQLLTPSGLMLKGREFSWEHINIMTRMYRVLCRLLFSCVKQVVFPSHFLREFYAHRGFFRNARLEVIPNPVEHSVRSTQTRHTEVTSGFALLYVGNIEEYKGIFFAVKTLQSVQQPFILHIVGDGKGMPALRELVKHDPRFFLHGYVPPEKLFEFFQKAELTIVPSLCYENLPTVILDSFSFGIPVLASRIGGIPELVHEGETGWLFEAGDMRDFQEKLLSCFQDRNLLRSCGERARDQYTKYSIASYLNALLSLHADTQRS